MKVKKHNVSRLILIASVILSVILLLNFLTMLFTMQSLAKNAAELNKEEFQSDAARLSENLKSVHSMMIAELTSDNELDKLLEEKSDRNLQIAEYATIKRLNTLMANWTGDLTYRPQYAIYLPSNQIEMSSCVQGNEFSAWRNIKSELYDDIKMLHYKSGWQIMTLKGNKYLIDIIQKNSICSICYIDVSKLFKCLDKKVYGKEYYFAISDANKTFEEPQKNKQSKILYTQMKLGMNKLDRDDLVVKAAISDDVYLYVVVKEYNRESSIFRVQIFMLIMLAVVVCMVMLFIRTLNKAILYPILKFNESVESYKMTENYDPKIHYEVKELENASDLMRDMIGRIQKLKIDIYEKTLEQQKTKMDFLSLQIEPHFYLNCLNNIFSMAQMHQFTDIQKLVSCVSVYLRYIFKNSDVLVTAQEELFHIEKYLEIQKMRYQDGFSYTIKVSDEVLMTRMPPLLLQTFVENSLKHTLNWEEDIEIKITGEKREKVTFIIEDTGEGFKEDVLEKLQKHENLSEDESHIGIRNAIARLAMVFGDEAAIYFENKPDSGASVRIEIPFMEVPDTQKEQSVFDEKR